MTITQSTKMETIEFASKGENITIIERLIDDLCAKFHIQEEQLTNSTFLSFAEFNGARQKKMKCDEL